MRFSRRTMVVTAIVSAALYAFFSILVALHVFDAADLRLHAWVVRNVGPTFLGISWSLWTSVGTGTLSTVAVALGAFLAWRAGAAKTAVVIIAAALLGGALVDGFKSLHHRPYPSGGSFSVTVVHNNGTACPENLRCDVRLEENATVYCPPGSRCNFYTGNGTQPSNATFIPADLGLFPERPGRAYPSGHTIGATVSWGVALLLGTRCVQRRKEFDAWAVGAWIIIALIGGISRVPVHAHWWTDVVGAWFLGIAVIAVAVIADDAWRDRRKAATDAPPSGPPAP